MDEVITGVDTEALVLGILIRDLALLEAQR